MAKAKLKFKRDFIIETHWINIPYFQEKRRVRVLLPVDYQTEKNYSVLYMHDGQNVYFDNESFVKYSWRVIQALHQTKQINQVIVVAVDNAGERRLDEYGPWKNTLEIEDNLEGHGGLGDQYAQWFVNKLMPFINHNYSTKTAAKDTLLAGSSMGGIITAYIGGKYPDLFGSLGVFSLASWFSEREFLAYLSQHPLNPESKVYIQVGTNEGDSIDGKQKNLDISQAYIDSSLRYYNLLVQQGHPLNHIQLKIMAGESHHEYYWAKHFKDYLNFSIPSSK